MILAISGNSRTIMRRTFSLLLVVCLLCGGCGMPPEVEQFATQYMDMFMKGDYDRMFATYDEKAAWDTSKTNFRKQHEKIIRFYGQPTEYQLVKVLRSRDAGRKVYEPVYRISFNEVTCYYGIQIVQEGGGWKIINWSVEAK